MQAASPLLSFNTPPVSIQSKTDRRDTPPLELKAVIPRPALQQAPQLNIPRFNLNRLELPKRAPVKEPSPPPRVVKQAPPPSPAPASEPDRAESLFTEWMDVSSNTESILQQTSARLTQQKQTLARLLVQMIEINSCLASTASPELVSRTRARTPAEVAQSAALKGMEAARDLLAKQVEE
jgi:hypothetical protein